MSYNNYNVKHEGLFSVAGSQKRGGKNAMSDIGMQESFHYVILKGRKETPWLADECVKKRFLNQLLKEREKISFRVYAFCILDKEAHFLVNIPAYGDIRRTAAKMSQGLQKSYLRQYPQGKEKVSVSRKHLSPCSLATVLEYCCNIHLLARGYAGKIQDYWWSSYSEYLRKNVTGLVETEPILQVLDAEPRRALQKFIQYHEKYALLIKNVPERKK